MRRGLLLGGLLVALAWPTSALAAPRDVIVPSFDGAALSTTFIPTAKPRPDGTAPTIMITHGWGATRTRDASGDDTMAAFGQASLKAISDAGYNILTWDSRGFGESGGIVSVDGPDFEGRDVQALIDFLAKQPEQQLDGPGDPRIGMHGPSYAGGIELVAAGLDKRIDAIAPAIAWHSLETSLNKSGAPKGGWASALVGLGSVTAPTLGVLSPAGPQTGGLDPRITSAFAGALATGAFPAAELEWFRSRGPGDLVKRITAPTLLVQGTADTLFTPHEAVVNQAILKGNGVPVQMLWFCGGHGVCLSGNTPAGLVSKRVVAWMDRWVKQDAGVDTGPAFEWTAHDGETRSADDYPLAAAAGTPPTATGKGTLAITPVDSVSSGALLIAATPAGGGAIKLPFKAPDAPVDVVGVPRLELTYRGTGTGLGAPVHVYAQLTDTKRDLVVGNQVVPVKVELDGKEHTTAVDLEEIATRIKPGDAYEVQLIPGSGVYVPQRATGTLTVTKATATLPAVDPAATRPARAPNLAPAPVPVTGARRCLSRRTVRIQVRRVRGKRVRSVTVRVAGRKPITRRAGKRKLRLSFRGLPAGKVRVRITGRTAKGRVVRQTRTFRLCVPKRR